MFDEFDIVWLNRTPGEDEWHLRLDLPEERTLTEYHDAVWDLRLIPPGDADPFYAITRSPVTFRQNYSDD